MKKIIILSLCIISYNTSWTSSAASSSSSINAASSRVYGEQEIAICITCKDQTPTTLLAISKNSKGVLGTLTPSERQLIAGDPCQAADIRFRHPNARFIKKIVFYNDSAYVYSLPETVLLYEAVTVQQDKATVNPNEEPDATLQRAIYKLHSALNNTIHIHTDKVFGIANDSQPNKFLVGNQTSLWHCVHTPEPRGYKKPYVFTFAQRIERNTTTDALAAINAISTHLQQMEILKSAQEDTKTE